MKGQEVHHKDSLKQAIWLQIGTGFSRYEWPDRQIHLLKMNDFK